MSQMLEIEFESVIPCALEIPGREARDCPRHASSSSFGVAELSSLDEARSKCSKIWRNKMKVDDARLLLK